MQPGWAPGTGLPGSALHKRLWPHLRARGMGGGVATPLRSTVPGGTLGAKLKESLKMHPGVSRRCCATDSGQQGPSTANCRARMPPTPTPALHRGRWGEGGCPAQGHTARTAGHAMQGRLPVHAPHCLGVARSQGGRVCGGQDTLPRLQPRLPHWGEGLGWLGQPNFQKKLKVQTISCEISII